MFVLTSVQKLRQLQLPLRYSQWEQTTPHVTEVLAAVNLQGSSRGGIGSQACELSLLLSGHDSARGKKKRTQETALQLGTAHPPQRPDPVPSLGSLKLGASTFHGALQPWKGSPVSQPRPASPAAARCLQLPSTHTRERTHPAPSAVLEPHLSTTSAPEPCRPSSHSEPSAISSPPVHLSNLLRVQCWVAPEAEQAWAQGSDFAT